ncbi:hypothetical protein N8I77_010078 [Diaporthe amygdali]|uniref:Uncharacterized protein n=1 Tax=Phomopsis amygdali TaxID=1214568 RepID=A0AAD9W1F7_PHOAM|nr:hypothetical protein N8I77_010078 [Diaporthe amygdali]
MIGRRGRVPFQPICATKLKDSARSGTSFATHCGIALPEPAIGARHSGWSDVKTIGVNRAACSVWEAQNIRHDDAARRLLPQFPSQFSKILPVHRKSMFGLV